MDAYAIDIKEPVKLDDVRYMIKQASPRLDNCAVVQLGVSASGFASILPPDVWESQNGVLAIFESWTSSYIGEEASLDDDWVMPIFRELSNLWEKSRSWTPQPGGHYLDFWG